MSQDLPRPPTLAELEEEIARYDRPQTFADCEHQVGPCPFASCKWNTFLDVDPRTGAVKFNFPGLEIWEAEENCSLRLAARGGMTLEEVGNRYNVTRERIRQVEAKAAARMRKKLDAQELAEEFELEPGPAAQPSEDRGVPFNYGNRPGPRGPVVPDAKPTDARCPACGKPVAPGKEQCAYHAELLARFQASRPTVPPLRLSREVVRAPSASETVPPMVERPAWQLAEERLQALPNVPSLPAETAWTTKPSPAGATGASPIFSVPPTATPPPPRSTTPSPMPALTSGHLPRVPAPPHVGVSAPAVVPPEPKPLPPEKPMEPTTEEPKRVCKICKKKELRPNNSSGGCSDCRTSRSPAEFAAALAEAGGAAPSSALPRPAVSKAAAKPKGIRPYKTDETGHYNLVDLDDGDLEHLLEACVGEVARRTQELEQRLVRFRALSEGRPVITAHDLDDQVDAGGKAANS